MPVNTSSESSIELTENTAQLAYYRDVPSTNVAFSWPYTAVEAKESVYRFQPVAINPAFLHLAHQEALTRAVFGYYTHRSLYEGLQASNYTPPTRDEEKPKQSYVRLISEAILNSPEKKLLLSEIYKAIQTNYAYFKNRGSGWKNSIRHNLSLNDCFVKLNRSPNGKGHYWTISPRHYEDFLRGSSHQRKFQKKQTSAFCYYPKELLSYGDHFFANTPPAQLVFEESGANEKQTETEVKEDIDVEKRKDSQVPVQHRPFDVENLLAVNPRRPLSY